jgi:hypothetical protein
MTKKQIVDEATKLTASPNHILSDLGKSILQFMGGTLKSIDSVLLTISGALLAGGVILTTCISLIIGFILYVVTILPASVLIAALTAQYNSIGDKLEASKDDNVKSYLVVTKNIREQKNGVRDIQEVSDALNISESVRSMIECNSITPSEGATAEEVSAYNLCSIIQACDERINASGNDNVYALPLQVASNLAPDDRCYHVSCTPVSEALGGDTIIEMVFLAGFFGYIGYLQLKDYAEKKVEENKWRYGLRTSPITKIPDYGSDSIKNAIAIFAYNTLGYRNSGKDILYKTKSTKSPNTVYLYRYNKRNLELVSQGTFESICNSNGISIKDYDDSKIADRKEIYEKSMKLLKEELKPYDKKLVSKAQWGIYRKNKDDETLEKEKFFNGVDDEAVVYYCTYLDVVTNSRSFDDDEVMNNTIFNPISDAIEKVNRQLPSGYKLDADFGTKEMLIMLHCPGDVTESYSILESVNFGSDDGTEMFMTLENVVREPLLSGTGLLHGIISIVTDACDRQSTLDFLRCYKNTAKYEFTHPNYSDIPLLAASGTILEYTQSRCSGNEELMESVNTMSEVLATVIDEAYNEVMDEMAQGGAQVTCANPSTTETGFNPDPFNIGNLTPFPVASRKVGYTLCEIDRAETDDEITEAMLNLARVATIIEASYVVGGDESDGYMIIESDAGKIARRASDKASASFSKAAMNDKTAGVKAAVKHTIDPMEKFIQQQYDTMKEKDANERRNIILKGGAGPKVMRWIKRGIGLLCGAAVGNVIPAASIITGITFIGYIATDKYLDGKERAKLLKELEDEIMICNEKIDDSRGDDNKQNKYELMRIRNQLTRTSEKIRLGLKY